MKTQKIIGAGLTLAMMATLGAGTADAMFEEKGEKDFSKARAHIKNRAQHVDLSDDQKEVLKELRESRDLDALKKKLEEYGVDLKKAGQHFTKNLSEEDKAELKELRESGDKEALFGKMKELGLKHGKKMGASLGIELSAEQREEIKALRESKDFDAVIDKLSDYGVSDDVLEKMKVRKENFAEQKEIFDGIFSDEDKEKLQAARDLVKDGDRKSAHELKKEVYEDNKDEILEAKEEGGFSGFFKKTKSFFRGWFK